VTVPYRKYHLFLIVVAPLSE